jgi:sirohydrochlorin cobaltochelatase
MGERGVLLVGHGTRSAAGVSEFLCLADMVAVAAPDLAVEPGFLELARPNAGEALDRLVGGGARDIAVIPLMLSSAGHTKSDVPAVLFEGRIHHREVTFSYGRPLGLDQRLLALAHRRIEGVGGSELPLLLVARGSSDPDANSDAWKAARLLWEHARPPFAEIAFAGITPPSVPEALARCRRLGAVEVVAFQWFLGAGLLIERVQSAFAESDVKVLDAGYFGPDPALVPLILERYGEAIGEEIRMNCDACAYRAPYPGLEDRVGQPLGVGHSNLAADHREHQREHQGSRAL